MPRYIGDQKVSVADNGETLALRLTDIGDGATVCERPALPAVLVGSLLESLKEEGADIAATGELGEVEKEVNDWFFNIAEVKPTVKFTKKEGGQVIVTVLLDEVVFQEETVSSSVASAIASRLRLSGDDAFSDYNLGLAPESKGIFDEHDRAVQSEYDIIEAALRQFPDVGTVISA